LNVQLESENPKTVNLLISSAAILGLITGSYAVKPFLDKFSQRSLIRLTLLLSAAAAVLTMFLNFYQILIGRFLFGFFSGCLVVTSSLFLNNVTPVSKARLFGFSTNFGVVTGIMICLVMGFYLPESDTEEAAETNYWRVIYGCPAGL